MVFIQERAVLVFIQERVVLDFKQMQAVLDFKQVWAIFKQFIRVIPLCLLSSGFLLRQRLLGN